jgi:hypothetical protein
VLQHIYLLPVQPQHILCAGGHVGVYILVSGKQLVSPSVVQLSEDRVAYQLL